MSAPGPDLTLLVPCFNEAARIQALLAAIRAWRAAQPDVSLEVLCVDDGSTDDTVACLEAGRAALPELSILCLARNGGKGAALKAGMAAARGGVVIFLDADLAVDLAHVQPALALVADGADVVAGCRNVAGAAVRRSQGRLRRWMGRGYRRLACGVLGLGVSDITCGFKAFRRGVGQALFADVRSDGWGFDAEILFLAQRHGYVLRELPVQWFHGEVSAVRLHRDVFGALRELLAVRLRYAFRKEPAPTADAAAGVTAGSTPEV